MVAQAQHPGKRVALAVSAKGVVPVALGIVAVSASCLVLAIGRFGSLQNAWLYAQGVRIGFERSVIALPTGHVGDALSAAVRLRNLTSAPVKVLGATVSCDCVTTEGLPFEVPAGASVELRSTVHLDGRFTGSFEQTITYFTDHPTVPSLRMAIRGNVHAPEAKGDARQRPAIGELSPGQVLLEPVSYAGDPSLDKRK